MKKDKDLLARSKASPINRIAKQLLAIDSKISGDRVSAEGLAKSMRDAPGQRTFTDEYSFNKKPKPREPVKADPSWELLAKRGKL